jgi:ATP-binding cassette subfamily F protein 2
MAPEAKAKKPGKYAAAAKATKKAAAAGAVDDASTVSSGASTAMTVESKAERAAAAAATARVGRPVPEMYPDIVCTYGTNVNKIDDSAKQVKVENLTMLFHGNVLLKEAEIVLSHGNRYGLVGANGSGKSTLLRAIGSGIIPRPKHIDVYMVERGMAKTDLTALQAVLEVDQEKAELEAEVERITEEMGVEGLSDEATTALSEALSDTYERLEELGADTAEARAALILDGLGFTPEMQAKKTKDFSGGWLMRIALAKALYLNPTFLILDEPTNHLDMGAVVWFEGYLKKFNKILLLVSHSQDFLNGVCTNIILLRQKTLEYFGGNYDTYLRTRSEKETQQMKKFEQEQQQIADMKEYIARFGHGSAKLARQAQSKEKVLDKMMRSGLTESVVQDKTVPIKFFPVDKLPPPVLQLQEVGFAYPNCELLYQGVDRGIDCDSRICLVGPNGAGKSTLLKLLLGELMPVKGMVRRHLHLKISSYQQHTVDQLPFDKTPLEYMMERFPKDRATGEVTSIQQVRAMVGKFGITGPAQVMKISQLSDGQRARIVFAEIAEDRPHIIMLDEPTNALDAETIDALAEALKQFDGGFVVVSHDIRLISQVAKEIWLIDDGQVSTFPGTIEDFKRMLEKEVAETGSASNSKKLKGDASRARKAAEVTKAGPVQPPKAPVSISIHKGGAAAQPGDWRAAPRGFEGMSMRKKGDDADGMGMLQPDADAKRLAKLALDRSQDD